MTIQYPLFKDVVKSYSNLFDNCAPKTVDFQTFKDNITRHYYYNEINYYLGEFVQRFNTELREQLDYFDHCVETSRLEYDKMNYNKNETHVTTKQNGQSDSNSDSRFQDTPVNAVVNSDNYNTNVTKSKSDNAFTNEGTQDTVFYHQTELKTNQDILLSEYDVYRNPYKLLYKRLDYLFMEVF